MKGVAVKKQEFSGTGFLIMMVCPIEWGIMITDWSSEEGSGVCLKVDDVKTEMVLRL